MTWTLPAVTLLGVLALAAEGTGDSPLEGAKIRRGRYIVNRVAMCGQCHTPRDAMGNLQPSQWLRGASVPLKSPFVNQRWALWAPRIAGLPPSAEDDLIRLLTQGIGRSGREPLAPMPPFRLSREDAEAVARYLRTLP